MAPGVTVTQACQGHICLGVPFGTKQYVGQAALATIQSHDERLRAIVRLGNHEGEETMVGKINIGRPAALHMLRYSANAGGGEDTDGRRGDPGREGDRDGDCAIGSTGSSVPAMPEGDGRGVARCVEKAATGGWAGSGAASGRHHEFDRDCC
eukprot:COSAG02_NODE_1471_length_12452_cov_7.724358_2_plen_152_part_00